MTVISMNVMKLRQELESDEGCVYEIYLCSEGRPTFGIGHLIRRTDPEYGREVGTPVSAERVAEAFEADIDMVLEDCLKLYPDFNHLPDEVQLIIANMMFNLGLPTLSKFRDMKACVDDEDWEGASLAMRDSKWYRQVKGRAERLCERMSIQAIPF